MTMAAAAVWGYFRNVPPSVLVGSLEFFIGGIICVSLFHYFIRLFCTLKIKRGEPLSHCDSVSLSCKLVSALFATFACVMGLIILRDCGCISIKLKHNAVKHYMCFGLSYFFYDIYAMFLVFKAGVPVDPKQGFHELLISFVKSRLLLVAHHLLLPFFIFPIFMGGLKSFGGGDCLVAAGFLLEASTPFVSLRKILAILDMKKSVWYIANGAVMTVVFLCCRVVFFPVVYYLYSLEHGASLWDTATKHVPPICSISMLVLFLPQVYWFTIMVKGGLKVIAGKETKED